jgi:hypothetical protein
MLPLWSVPTNPIPQFINSRCTSHLKPPQLFVWIIKQGSIADLRRVIQPLLVEARFFKKLLESCLERWIEWVLERNSQFQQPVK